VNVIQHTLSCLSYLVAICFYFINQPSTLYIVFDKCFYICDVVVIKFLYIIFLIYREQFAFQVHALRTTIKLGFWGTSGRCLGHSLVKSCCLISRASERNFTRGYEDRYRPPSLWEPRRKLYSLFV